MGGRRAGVGAEPAPHQWTGLSWKIPTVQEVKGKLVGRRPDGRSIHCKVGSLRRSYAKEMRLQSRHRSRLGSRRVRGSPVYLLLGWGVATSTAPEGQDSPFGP